MKVLLCCLAIFFFSLFCRSNAQMQEPSQVWELAPILNYVFFDLGSSEIPHRYKLFNSPAETTKFNADSLKGSPLEKYYNLLNIVGSRLVMNPDLKISITGCTDATSSEEKRSDLSKERADAVYNYLKNIWGISEDRMRLIYRNLSEQVSNLHDSNGIVENRRVEITTCDENEKLRLLLPILDRNPSTTLKRQYCNDSIETLQRVRINQGEKWSYETYSLILFPFSMGLFPTNQSIVEKFVFHRINNKSIIQVVGHTDIVGLDTRNQKISAERAATFAKIIKNYSKRQGWSQTIVKYCGLGEGSPIYSNETPEGRFYNRMVQIIIQNPIEE